MSKFFYARLAAVNIRKNGRIYIPYLLTGIFTVAMFYIMLFLTLNSGMSHMNQALPFIMGLGSAVIGIFSAIILLYTNSFLMKRRKKELGLYNILGMGKNHIGRVMSLETVYVALVTIAVGLFAGILLSKLMLMLLMKMLQFPILFGFEVSPIAVGVTVVLFAGIFFFTLLLNLGRVHLSKPIELLYGGNVGEKEPKTKWLLAVIGVFALGVGYTIAIVTDNPLQALGLFFIAVLLVILGTFCLFTAGSIALLKALRKNKRYYYRTKHFTSVSGMIYRMKQNAAGLANICILSTMVLVMVSTTVSLYIGMEDALRNRFPRNIEISVTHLGPEQRSALEDNIAGTIKNAGASVINLSEYSYKTLSISRSGSGFIYAGDQISSSTSFLNAYFIPLDDYNRLQGTAEKLSGNELLVYSPDASFNSENISFGNLNYQVKASLKSLAIENYYMIANLIYFIVPDTESIQSIYSALNVGGTWNGFSFYYGFDVRADGAGQLSLANQLGHALTGKEYSGNSDVMSLTGAGSNGATVSVTSAEANRQMFLYLYGGLFFLGLFLGTLFIMATVIIMYYKQMSEGYDDKIRFEIMQKVGLGRDEIKKTIRSQVLTVFFLPLAASGIHILAAFKMITKLLYLLNLTNVRLFAECTLGTFAVFAVVYAAVYALTAKTYYKIVS